MTDAVKIDKLAIEYIKELVPLRFPMLLVDRVLEWEPGQRIVAIKAFTNNEVFFGAESPTAIEPPRSMMIEAFVQVAGLTLPKRPNKFVYLIGLNDIHIHRSVQFGEIVETRAERVWQRANMFRIRAVSYIDGIETMVGEVTYGYLDAPESDETP